MADSTEGDTMVLYPGILAPALISLIAGLVIHSFIIVINVNDWRKGRSVTPVDRIVTFLAISRMCFPCVVMPHFFGIRFLKSLYLIDPQIIIDAVYSFFIYTNICLTSLLSIVLCLKISSLRTRLFLYLRRMTEQRTVHFIAASGLLSIASCFLPLLIFLMTKGTYNINTVNQFLNCTNAEYIYSFTTISIIPLVFFFSSSGLLFASLYHHTRRMKMSSNLSINLETYYSTMKFVSFTFIYNIINYTGHFLCALYYYFYCEDLLWFDIFLAYLPALHSSYLIYRTAKLRSQMSMVLQNVIDFLFQRKDAEIRENIEVVAQ